MDVQPAIEELAKFSLGFDSSRVKFLPHIQRAVINEELFGGEGDSLGYFRVSLVVTSDCLATRGDGERRSRRVCTEAGPC